MIDCLKMVYTIVDFYMREIDVSFQQYVTNYPIIYVIRCSNGCTIHNASNATCKMPNLRNQRTFPPKKSVPSGSKLNL